MSAGSKHATVAGWEQLVQQERGTTNAERGAEQGDVDGPF